MSLRIALAFAVAVLNLAGCAAPEREARANAIVSARDPAVRITVSASAIHVGVDRFVLLGIADCELHVFVEADAQRNVRRLYWIQFEGYLPTRPELHHMYDSPRHASMAGLDFYVDTWVSPEQPQAFEADSDVTHMRELVRSKGYQLPARMRSARFVHLLDAAKRRELMIIYAEDLSLGDMDGLTDRARERVALSPE